MSNCRCFSKVCILGAGKLVTKCILLLLEEGVEIELFDVSINGGSLFLENFAKNNNIKYLNLQKSEIFERIREDSSPTLLLSISNPYIIPYDILEKDNILAVNFHHALLPNHPGRNGEAWAIYEEDQYAGITWHFLTSEIDAGDIIVQEQMELDENITAIKLFTRQDELGIIGFSKFYKDILNNTIIGKKQVKDKFYKLHLAKERPNDANLDLSWKAKKISAFLRSMDYGPLRTLGKPYVIYDEQKYVINKYKIAKNNTDLDMVKRIEDKMIISREDYVFELFVSKEI